MIRGGKGGRTPLKHGLHFEKRTDVATVIAKIPGYSVVGDTVVFGGKDVARLYKKNKLYTGLLATTGVDYRKLISKKLLPDDAVLVLVNKTLFVVETKFQTVAGSVDEKLQTCDFKLKQYRKLITPLGLDVKYVYVLNDWFRKKEYADVLAYIKSVGCEYFFEEIPLSYLGLPIPNK
ncbi:hypothetical protein COX86_02615 [Candidatus Micrarchaeota archaeon CG_4_10_14_0_2_um_filter_60_11]|nr:MAG: hypothetical protein AUJ16_00450 [Candidatus Micrarchaeota archaeon CG1_02_60_51]PIN96254.1 MAG: hypothetical protein COU39_02015 [Candidatus Micrarchaeota archaeon CG10_big_fil_rev_8_21_14_0_10_60_32]PIO02155.1 MAG: hypothetical protein COT58_01485 [Candidatus Micrarchaeota archaeon CG09_land_8_20_14_0_10_60_16]PIY91370.1 MAG: hypothetical protein COY71_03555 [Candidatus Micrarchaeota archaeon CG_4_10_14_0_8_um_filter_60_7]PIZ90901.1 MAG: hypothetical protein COX86_02615 [Candidatus Mi